MAGGVAFEAMCVWGLAVGAIGGASISFVLFAMLTIFTTKTE
jgi:hypothetical protein